MASHVACTVEMANLAQQYEVAVIDEIQVIKDYQRGWAWTRALLGIQAEEIHVCGEEAAVDLIREMMISTGEEVQTILLIFTSSVLKIYIFHKPAVIS